MTSLLTAHRDLIRLIAPNAHVSYFYDHFAQPFEYLIIQASFEPSQDPRLTFGKVYFIVPSERNSGLEIFVLQPHERRYRDSELFPFDRWMTASEDSNSSIFVSLTLPEIVALYNAALHAQP